MLLALSSQLPTNSLDLYPSYLVICYYTNTQKAEAYDAHYIISILYCEASDICYQFSEFKRPVEVAIALVLPVDQVHEINQEYWELDGMYRLVQIYEEAKYDLHDLLALHKIVKDHGIEKQDIINAFDFVKHNQLRALQWKAVYVRYQINKLEMEKTEAMNHLFKLKKMTSKKESD